ncbi:MAG: peptidoglycan recognition family protein [Verrucomicrobiota bacterium]
MKNAFGRFSRYFRRKPKPDKKPATRQKNTSRVRRSPFTPPAPPQPQPERSSNMNIEYRDQLDQHGRHTPRRIILHHTNGYFESSIEYLAKVGYGYHYLIDFDGKIVRCVPPDQLCYHAKNHNTGSIGIAFNGDTNTGELRPDGPALTEHEVLAASTLIRELRRTFEIKEIRTHAEVDPKRKQDISPAAKKQILDALDA